MEGGNDEGAQKELLYNFFHSDLWLARVDGMVWLLRMTSDVIDSTLEKLEGMTVRKYAQLLHSLGAGNLEPLVDQLESAGEGTGYETLIQQFKQAETNEAVEISLLTSYLVGLLEKRKVPLSAKEPEWAVHFDFEVQQLINLHTLHLMYIYFFADMRELINESLSVHAQAHTHAPLHVIQSCYRHFANDIEILQRAVLQRQPIVDAAGKSERGVLAKELVITNKLAMMALAPLEHLLPSPTILTFFSQDTHIRRLPFSDLYLVIGLSHARISTTYNDHHRSGEGENDAKPLPPFELLAIPHEIGHYLYNNSLSNGLDPTPSSADAAPLFALSGQFQDNLYRHWSEELFADLYGCVVAGPIAVLGMQALLAASAQDQLWVDDGEHPIPLVRPYILSEMLRVLEAKEAVAAPTTDEQPLKRYRFPEAAESLDANWSAVLQQWGFELGEVTKGRPVRVTLPPSAHPRGGKTVEVDKLLTDVKPIIKELATRLLARVEFDPWPTGGDAALSAKIPWVREDYQQLSRYEDAIVGLISGELARKEVKTHKLITPNFWNDKWKSIFKGTTADEKLLHWLDDWGDRGPHTIGGH